MFGAFALLIAAFAAPANAMSAAEPVGERVVVIVGETVELEADEAFHVQHGWGPFSPRDAGPIGHWGFWLEIDGVDQGRGQPVNSAFGPNGGVIRTVLYNYPEGLPAGEYEFTGHWFGPCHEVVEDLEALGLPGFECEFENQEVDYPLDEAFGIPTSVMVIVTGRAIGGTCTQPPDRDPSRIRIMIDPADHPLCLFVDGERLVVSA